MPDLSSGEKIEVDGSSGNRYVLSRDGDVYSCSCPAWKHGKEIEKRRTCKHLKAFRGEIAEKARVKFVPKSPIFQGQPLEDTFRSDLLDEAEQLIEKGEIQSAYELVEEVHRAKKQGEAISLFSGPDQIKWIENHVTRAWKLRADILAILAKEEPSLQAIADGAKQAADRLEKYAQNPPAPKEGRPKLRLVKPGDTN